MPERSYVLYLMSYIRVVIYLMSYIRLRQCTTLVHERLGRNGAPWLNDNDSHLQGGAFFFRGIPPNWVPSAGPAGGPY